jgi:hypothetical protein
MIDRHREVYGAVFRDRSFEREQRLQIERKRIAQASGDVNKFTTADLVSSRFAFEKAKLIGTIVAP